MPNVALIHWRPAEAEAAVEVLRSLGYDVDLAETDNKRLSALKRDPPDAVVIDLSRLPSHGRAIGYELRRGRKSRFVPLVFVGGALEKVQVVQELLPDAFYTDWDELGEVIAEALANPPEDPVIPQSDVSSRPLAGKLGLKPGIVFAIENAPDNFERTLGRLPRDVRIVHGFAHDADLVIWFVVSAADLTHALEVVTPHVLEGMGLWIAWPKKASGVVTDVDQNVVIKAGLAAGLVDFKVCAIDQTWSGSRFARRKS